MDSSIKSQDDKSVNLDDSKGGYRRSLVRRIGAKLPLANVQRPRFELLPDGAKLIENNGQKSTLFSLSDICQLMEIPEVFPTSRSSMDLRADVEFRKEEDVGIGIIKSTSMSSLPAQNEAMPIMANKITALEDELSQLRSQIAMLVSNQHKNDISVSFNSTMSGAGEPALCSTPIKPPPSLIPPPPTFIPPPPSMIPPPPAGFIPPPPPFIQSKPQPPMKSVAELIRERKKAKGIEVGSSQPPKQQRAISMADVLKDLHKVKLKSVTRSPGGTPGNKKAPAEPDQSDPAAFIAAALRKKFAHRKRVDSPDGRRKVPVDKEWEESPPKFGQHLLKKRTSLNQVDTT